MLLILDIDNVENRKVMNYLSDCGFFTNFWSRGYFQKPSLRPTTLTLKHVETSRINQWKQLDLMIWLQKQTKRKNDFHQSVAAIDEYLIIFRIIQLKKIGCIFLVSTIQRRTKSLSQYQTLV